MQNNCRFFFVLLVFLFKKVGFLQHFSRNYVKNATSSVGNEELFCLRNNRGDSLANVARRAVRDGEAKTTQRN